MEGVPLIKVSVKMHSVSSIKVEDSYESSRILPRKRMGNFGIPQGIPLGEGSYGKVYPLGDHYALKVYQSHKGRYLRVDTLREIAIMLRCKDPNILEIVDLSLTLTPHGNSYSYDFQIVMPRAEFSLTAAIFAGTAFRPENRLEMAKGLLQGLNYLHNRGIIHRDLNTNNILLFPSLGGSYQAQISDFGLSMAYGCFLPSEGTIDVYALEFSAPEVLLLKSNFLPEEDDGETLYSEKADIWALGCTFYQLFTLARQPLFRSSLHTKPTHKYYQWVVSGAETFNYYKRSQFERVFGSDHLQALRLVKEMLAVDPYERLDTEDLLIEYYETAAPLRRCEEILQARSSLSRGPRDPNYVWSLVPYQGWIYRIIQSRYMPLSVYYQTLWILDFFYSTQEPNEVTLPIYALAAFLIGATYYGYSLTLPKLQELEKRFDIEPLAANRTEYEVLKAIGTLLMVLKFDLAQYTSWHFLQLLEGGAPEVELFTLSLTPLRFLESPKDLASRASDISEKRVLDTQPPLGRGEDLVRYAKDFWGFLSRGA